MPSLKNAINRLRTGSKFLLAVAGAAVVGGVTTGVVMASVPDSSGVIHGCYDTNKGTLSVVDSDTGGACSNKQIALNWNQTGPPGPAGPQGPQGPAGSGGLLAYGHIYFDSATRDEMLDSALSSNILSVYPAGPNWGSNMCIEVNPSVLANAKGVSVTPEGNAQIGDNYFGVEVQGLTPDNINDISQQCTGGPANMAISANTPDFYFSLY